MLHYRRGKTTSRLSGVETSLVRRHPGSIEAGPSDVVDICGYRSIAWSGSENRRQIELGKEVGTGYWLRDISNSEIESEASAKTSELRLYVFITGPSRVSSSIEDNDELRSESVEGIDDLVHPESTLNSSEDFRSIKYRQGIGGLMESLLKPPITAPSPICFMY
ncbi:hypothetical protein Aperf_G00000002086 [Anoplocephala perfoliata]